MYAEVVFEAGEKILKIDLTHEPEIPTIEDNPKLLSFILNQIIEKGKVNKVEINQFDAYIYPPEQTYYLNELAEVGKKIRKEILPKLLKYDLLYNERVEIFNMLSKNFFSDPIGTYVHVKRLSRKIYYLMEKTENAELKKNCQDLLNTLKFFISLFESTKLYFMLKDFLVGYEPGDRMIYKRIFHPDIRPSFLYAALKKSLPEDINILETYKIEDAEVLIFEKPGEISMRYYIFPPEFFLPYDQTLLLTKIREMLASYSPERVDYLEPQRLRETFQNLVLEFLDKLSLQYNVNLNEKDKIKLAKIITRYTIGFGVLEYLLKDEKIQDILINPPLGKTPIFVNHADYEQCVTNIYVSSKEAESWATKLRLISGRPFDEANPVLDTEIDLGGIRTRVCAVMEPLSPKGLGFALRRHRSRPWTLPLFIENKMLSPLAAGLLSLLVDAGRTILIAGTRGAGKTSLLTALMLEIPRKVRMITIEDVLEIPTDYFRKLGYNILSLKVRSPLSLQTSELSADDGIKVSLRLGDSALIIGEVRSKEAVTLYEAMRVGALANVVMGTIHAESPYGVYDRVVNDLGVPKTSFKATDIIIIANPIKDPSGLRKYRRVLRITEVRKHWEKDPLMEKGFVDLMIYDVDKDELKPTSNLIHGDSEILKSVASRIKVFAGSWEKLWENVLLRAEAKRMLVDYAKKTGNRELLEADFVVKANDVLHKIMDEVYEEIDYPERKECLRRFEKWLQQNI